MNMTETRHKTVNFIIGPAGEVVELRAQQVRTTYRDRLTARCHLLPKPRQRALRRVPTRRPDSSEYFTEAGSKEKALRELAYTSTAMVQLS